LIAAFVCIRRDFSAIALMSACSVATLLSASLSVTPNHLVNNTMERFLRGIASWAYLKLEMNLIAVTLGRKQYAAARVAIKLGNPVIFIGGAPLACGITKILSDGSCDPIIGSFDLGCSLTDPANSLSLTQCPSTNSYWFSILELMK
jgi:hypothetical protein